MVESRSDSSHKQMWSSEAAGQYGDGTRSVQELATGELKKFPKCNCIELSSNLILSSNTTNVSQNVCLDLIGRSVVVCIVQYKRSAVS